MTERMILTKIPSCHYCDNFTYWVEYSGFKVAGHIKCDQGVFYLSKELGEVNNEFKEIVIKGKIPYKCPLEEYLEVYDEIRVYK